MFTLIFSILFAFQPHSEVVQPAARFHDRIPKFGATVTDDVVDNPIPFDIANDMFNSDANR